MMTNKTSRIAERLVDYTQQVSGVMDMKIEGRLVRMVGLTLEAVGCEAPVGSRCLITNYHGRSIEAEVVGFGGETIYLMSTENTHGLVPGAKITPLGRVAEVPVGECLLGRVLDGQGAPLDGKPPIISQHYYPLTGKLTNPLSRDCIRDPLDVGVRTINALCPIGRGQRMGLFAGSGVGKSVLLGMMTHFTTADVIVVGLIGERGREVKEFIEYNLGEDGLRRSVVIAAPADTSPLMRTHGAMWATSIAEYFRDQGANVLLLVDSLTRFAQAHRELGLAIGEPPATKGYPPSVFSKLSQLVERAGNGTVGGGSITAFYTVLAEGDDQQDPVADSARSFLDGHIVLSRQLADAGYYPAIDIEGSISRVMQVIATDQHIELAKTFKRIYSKYIQSRDLINVGAYTSGADPELDVAIQMMPKLREFMAQDMLHKVDYEQSINHLRELFMPSNEADGENK